MVTRITQQQAIDSAIRQAQIRQTQIGVLQSQLATGLRVTKPSDAPAEWGTLTALKSTVESIDIQLDNISTVRQRLNQSVATLTEAGNLLVRAREIALEGAQSSDGQILASEVDRLISSMLSIANTMDGGIHLYSGTSSDQPAFEATEVDELGRIMQVRYVGSVDTSPVSVSGNETAAMLANGSEIFEQSERETSTYHGSTGAAAGVGTDSASGTGELLVRHVSTSYQSIVSPGASSSLDTVIGAPGENKLSIEIHPTLGHVARLNGGSVFPFDTSSTDLKVIGPNGAAIHVDLSSVPPTLETTIDITATGTLSVDGGITEVPIDYTSSQIVQNSASGEVTVVDSTNIRKSGSDRIDYRGSGSVFAAMIQLREDLDSREDWSTAEFSEVMDSRIADIRRAHDQVLAFVGEQSVELANLETLETRLRDLQLFTQESVGEIENVDVAEAVVELQNQQNHLQFIYASTAAVMESSLLDFI